MQVDPSSFEYEYEEENDNNQQNCESVIEGDEGGSSGNSLELDEYESGNSEGDYDTDDVWGSPSEISYGSNNEWLAARDEIDMENDIDVMCLFEAEYNYDRQQPEGIPNA